MVRYEQNKTYFVFFFSVIIFRLLPRYLIIIIIIQ